MEKDDIAILTGSILIFIFSVFMVFTKDVAIAEEPDPNFTVSFETNSEVMIGSIDNIPFMAKINEPEDVLEKEGYDFAGWFKDAFYEEKWDFDRNVVNKNITLYAKWEEKTNFTNINILKFQELYNKNEKAIIYIGRDNNESCLTMENILNEIVEEYQPLIYYLDINELSQEELEVLLETLSYFNEETSLQIPKVLITESGRTINEFENNSTKEEIINVLRENAIIQ